MNIRNAEKNSLSMAKSCDKDSLIRSEESLARAASILKSLSDWHKEK